MLYAVAIFAGIAAGAVAGGRIANLPGIRLEKKWLILLAFAIQVLTQVLGINGVAAVAEYSLVIQLAVYCLLLAALWFNRHYAGIWMVGAGCMSNVLVMMLNGGRMPVDKSLLAASASDRELLEKLLNDGKHVIQEAGTKLAFLGDIIPMPGILSYGTQVVSIGDIIAAFGVFVIIIEVMRKKASSGK